MSLPSLVQRVARHCPALVAFALFAGRLQAQDLDRVLFWPAVDVTARLDSAGRLHVRERQDMSLTGDWNGGERTFRVDLGQDLTLNRMIRIDSLGQEHAMVENSDLDAIDQFSWTSGWTLRWRSRLPTDPPFNQALRTYVIDLTYDNVVKPEGNGFRLDHDFAYSDRVGAILAYTLKLTLDPVWRAPGDFTGEFGPMTLAPGEGFTVNIPLRFAGEGRPGSVIYGSSRLYRLGLAIAFIAVVAVLFGAMVAHERAKGRFTPLLPLDGIDRPWLDEHVFRLPPEAVGAAWDDSTAGPEVAAVLARLVSEGKLKSEVKSTGKGWFRTDVMHLELLVNRSVFKGHERQLIDALFMGHSRFTDTQSIRERYKSSGFDPASKIKDGIDAVLRREGRSATVPKPSKWPTAIAVVVGVALLVFGAIRNPADGILVPFAIGASIALMVIAVPGAVAWRTRVVRLWRHTLWFVVPFGIVTGIFVYVLTNDALRNGELTLLGLAILLLGVWNSIMNQARSRQAPEYIAHRKLLCAAREYFRRELTSEQPRLEDHWFPWLIGFGLGPNMDKWFKAFGGERAGSPRRTTSFGTGGSSSSSGSTSWTGMGGGGGFSGGGSSGSWAAAAGVMASGVSKPSSSSSGGSRSSGGSSSSGGGGGGGW